LWPILGQLGPNLINRQRLTEGGEHFLRNLNGGFTRQLECSEIGAQMIAAVAEAHDLQTGSQAIPGVGHHTPSAADTIPPTIRFTPTGATMPVDFLTDVRETPLAQNE
jgi:hypothetical protein